jgi:hypothetical protein
MAFNKDYYTKLSKVTYEVIDSEVISRLSNADNTSIPLTYRNCTKYLFNKNDYSNCVKNINTTISLPCNSEIANEGGNIWRLEGPYKKYTKQKKNFNIIKKNYQIKNFSVIRIPLSKNTLKHKNVLFQFIVLNRVQVKIKLCASLTITTTTSIIPTINIFIITTLLTIITIITTTTIVIIITLQYEMYISNS